MSAVTLRGEEASWDLYTVTSNHVHLIIRDAKGEEVIPQTIQLIARRTVQENNQRKDRRGAFWEYRYHATAVERWKAWRQLCPFFTFTAVYTGIAVVMANSGVDRG